MLCAMVTEGDETHYPPYLSFPVLHLHGMNFPPLTSRSSESHGYQGGEPVFGHQGFAVYLTCLEVSVVYVCLRQGSVSNMKLRVWFTPSEITPKCGQRNLPPSAIDDILGFPSPVVGTQIDFTGRYWYHRWLQSCCGNLTPAFVCLCFSVMCIVINVNAM